MFIPQAPIEPPTNLNVISEVQAAEQLQRGDLRQVIKEIFLRHLVNGTIKKNEQQDVRTGVTIRDLKEDRTLIGHNQDEVHFAASVNKIPVALLVLDDLRTGELDLDQTMTWQASDQRGGFGEFDQPGAPLQAPLRDVIYDMLNRSGNTVVRVLVNYALGGPEAVNDRFAAQEGLPNTSLTPLGGDLFYLGDSTSRDSLWAMNRLMEGQDSYGAFMKDALTTNIFTDFGVRSQLAGSDYIVLANKVGILDDIEGNNRHDTGIIYNTKTHRSYGYSFFTTAPFDPDDYSATEQANQSLKDMGRYTLWFAGDRKRHAQEDSPNTLSQPQAEVESRIVY